MKNILTALAIFFCLQSFAQDKDLQQVSRLMDRKDYSKALRLIDDIMKQEPPKADLYLLKSICLIETKAYQEAYVLLTKAIGIFPDDFHLYNHRGNLLLASGAFDEAEYDFEMALNNAKVDSLKLSGYLNRSAARSSKRDFNKAYDDLLKAYALDSNNVAVLNNLGAVSDEIGKGDETIAYMKRIIAIDSNFNGAYVNIGFKLQNMNRHQEAIYYFDIALRKNPKEALAFSNRSYSKLQVGDLKGALSDINESIKLYPGNSYAFRNRGLIYIAKKEKEKACADFHTALNKGFTIQYGEEVNELVAKHCVN